MQKSATRETPFALAFGTEAVAPVEVGLKSPRIELAAVEHNDKALRLNLDLLDEKHEQVLRRTKDYQRKTARYYNQKVKPRGYMPGDLVLKKLLPARKNQAHGKLGPNWEGPYIISRVVRPGNYGSKQRRGKSYSMPGMRNILSVFISRFWFVMEVYQLSVNDSTIYWLFC